MKQMRKDRNDDHILRREAIEAMNHLSYPSSLADVKWRLYNLAPAPEDQPWTPCSARLPEDGVRVYVTISNGTWHEACEAYYSSAREKWLNPYTDEDILDMTRGTRVTAWLKLPPPYEINS